MENFNSVNNKYELWNLFGEKGYFNHIKADDIEEIQKLFEESIVEITNMVQLKNAPLNVLNGETEKRFKKKMSIKNEEKKNNQYQNYSLDTFNKDLEQKSKELNEYMTTNKPDEIDFSIPVDEPFKENMDELINDAISKRQNDLQQIVDTFPKVDKIESDISNNNTINNINDLPTNNLEVTNKTNDNIETKQMLKSVLTSQVLMIELLEKLEIKINIIEKNIINIKNKKNKVKPKK